MVKIDEEKKISNLNKSKYDNKNVIYSLSS